MAMTIEEMLKQRHTLKLTFSEPWPAMNADGTEFTACVDRVATVHDCVGIARKAIWELYGKTADDAACLDHFIVVHYAQVQE